MTSRSLPAATLPFLPLAYFLLALALGVLSGWADPHKWVALLCMLFLMFSPANLQAYLLKRTSLTLLPYRSVHFALGPFLLGASGIGGLGFAYAVTIGRGYFEWLDFLTVGIFFVLWMTYAIRSKLKVAQ